MNPDSWLTDVKLGWLQKREIDPAKKSVGRRERAASKK